MADLAREAEAARLEHDLSFRAIGEAVGIDRAQVARIFRGQSPRLSVVRAAEVLAAVGLVLSARPYPGGPAIRDASQLALLARFRDQLGPGLSWRSETPVVELPGSGDLRAWDGAIAGGERSVRVEAETALRDVQSLLRRLALKQRDASVDCVILVINETPRNRAAWRLAEADLRSMFPGGPRAALRALRDGRVPAENVALFL